MLKMKKMASFEDQQGDHSKRRGNHSNGNRKGKGKPQVKMVRKWVKKDDLVPSKEVCPICTDENARFTLKCGHIFHEECIRMQIKSKWTGVRITFNFLDCGICRQQISHESIESEIENFKTMQKKIHELAVVKAIEDDLVNGLQGDELVAHCMKTLAFYLCKECSEPYCGGLISCAQDLEIDPNSLRCQKCVFAEKSPIIYLDKEEKIPDLRCTSHGYKHAMFKCDSCCNIATYDCIVNHYCDRCHGQASAHKDFPCPGIEKCALGIPHPKNLPALHCTKPDPVPFVIGCMKCAGLADENHFYGGAPHVF